MNRRRFLKRLGLASAVYPFARSVSALAIGSQMGRQLLFTGTYTTETDSKGIYIHYLDVNLGTLTPHKIVSGVTDPSFLAVGRANSLLFAVNETLEYEGMKSGAVSSFSIDRQAGDLRFLNRQPSMGAAPCHI